MSEKFKHFAVVSLVRPKTSEKVFGFIEDVEGGKKTLVHHTEDRHYHTNARIDRDALLKGLNCELASEGDLSAGMQRIRTRLMNPVSIKKGMVVSLNHQGKDVTARVLKGGRDVTVALDMFKWLRLDSVTVDPVENYPSEGPMAGYAVESYTIVSGHDDSTPFKANISLNGKVTLLVANDGWGGPDAFSPAKGSKPADEVAFYDSINQTVKEALDGRSDLSGMGDVWLAWDWYYRPTGLSFKDYLRDFTKDF
jgi:hypothetical protein